MSLNCSNGTPSEASDDVMPLGFKVTFAAILVTYIVIGTLGNLLILVTIGRRKEMHSAPNVFIANLAVANLLVCGLFLPIFTWQFIHGRRLALDDPLCQMEAFLNVLSNGATLISIMLVAINRCCIICFRNGCRWFTKHAIVLLIAAVWLYTLAFATLLPAGVAPIAHLSDSSCGPGTPTVKLIYYLSVLAAPITVTIICYATIYVYIKKHRRVAPVRLVLSTLTLHPRVEPHHSADDSKVLKTILAVSCIYGICCSLSCFTSYVLVHVVAERNASILYMTGCCILYIIHVANFFIYLTRNPTFRAAFVALLTSLKRAQSQQRTSDMPSNRIPSIAWPLF